MSDGLLDRLGLGALAGFAIGVAVASSSGEERTLKELGRDILAECLRLVEDPRLAAALSAAPTVAPLAATLSPPSTLTAAPAASPEEPRPRRRRRTRAQIEAENAAAAAAAAPPATSEEPAPRRRGRRPAASPVPVAETIAAEAGVVPPEGPPPTTEAGPEPRRRGRRPRQSTAEAGNGASAPAPAPVEATPPALDAGPPRAGDARVNLNTATRGELMRLPRIGAQAADRILQFREEQGRITGSRQLRQADVLSATAWKQIREQVRF